MIAIFKYMKGCPTEEEEEFLNYKNCPALETTRVFS